LESTLLTHQGSAATPGLFQALEFGIPREILAGRKKRKLEINNHNTRTFSQDYDITTKDSSFSVPFQNK
jgi:hypothetical protein